jgi:ParB family chromosome partitioning protein
MTAINHAEAQAIHATASAARAVLLEAADPSKNLILVPLSRLVSRPTGSSVRKTLRMSIPELAASIQRVGLLQNLIVTATADGERYEVVAGGTARTASLTKTVQCAAKKWSAFRLLLNGAQPPTWLGNT